MNECPQQFSALAGLILEQAADVLIYAARIFYFAKHRY